VEQCENLSDVFSRFRHQIEISNGIRNLEVPIGRLCSKPAFGLFVHHCVANSESLWNTYNQCRSDYRTRRGIRNQAQPVLELDRQESSLELPFWVYRTLDTSNVDRRRLWIGATSSKEYALRDHAEEAQSTIVVQMPKDRQKLTAFWMYLEQQGICIRPRALMTTMYLRCLIADLFVHGIGGGTYDELTDDIIRRWLGIEPPRYMISSASLHLNMNQPERDSQQSDWSKIHRTLQLMRSVPERFLSTSVESQRTLIEVQAKHLSKVPARGHKKAWHQQMVQIKTRIGEAIANQKRAALSQEQDLLKEQQQIKIRKSREYSFVLFPEKDVTKRLSDLAEQAMQTD